MEVFDEIPVVDIGDALEGAEPSIDFSASFTDICHRVGFALITNHGVDAALTEAVFDMMQAFFSLDEGTKRLIDKNNSPQFRGWEPVGAESTDNRPDLREQIDVWTEWPADAAPDQIYNRLLGPNQWLPDDVLPGHRDLSLRWIDALADVADRLMAALSLGLGLHAGHLRALFGEQTMSLAKFIHYPPTPDGGAGVNPHHDAGFITVLAPGPTPGLQVENQAGEWIDVPTVPDTFVINLGEMLQSISGNYLVATPHRVITAEERFAAGYFHGPALSTSLAPLDLAPPYAEAVAASPYHQGAGFMPTKAEADAGTSTMRSDYAPSTYGEQLWNYFTRSYPDAMQRHHGATV